MANTHSTINEGSSLKAYGVLLMGVAAVSLAAIFIRLAQEEAVPSLLIAAGRLTLAALILTPMTLRRRDYVEQIRQLSPFDLRLALVSGFFLAMHFATWVTSLEYTTVLISVVLVTTTPIWVAILETVFLKTHLSRRVISGMLVALAGGSIIGLGGQDFVGQAGGESWFGAALSLVGAWTVAVYLVIGKKLRAQLSLTPYIWLVYGCAALVMCVVLLITRTELFGYPALGYLWIFTLSMIPQLVGHSSLNYALAYLPATYVSLSTQLEPILSAMIAIIVFSEVPGVIEVAGGVIIIVGVVFATWNPNLYSNVAARAQVVE